MITTILLSAALAAHPLGNFSVNQLVELTLHPDRVDAVAVLDLAELPTMQLTPDCATFAARLDVRIDGKALRWNVQSQRLERAEGAAGLQTSRLTCELSAPAALDASATVSVVNRYLPDRVGWHELAVAGVGVSPQTDLPSRSATDRLRNYPQDPLDSPPDVRSAEFTTRPGADTTRAAAGISSDTGWVRRAEAWLAGTIGDPTPLVLLLAVVFAAILGAAHAALPGHGKTVMAVYLAGRQGRRRDAFIVGGSVTLTHTVGVLILGILSTTLAGLAAESVLKWLGVASGVLMTIVGLGILIGGLRHRQAHHHHRTHHHPDHHRKSLTALGIAGGLVPSPTALVVLLGAAALGRLWLGLILIVAYGLGMAAMLTAAGLLLLRLRDRWAWLGKIAVPPEATGSVILVLGFGLAARAALAI